MNARPVAAVLAGALLAVSVLLNACAVGPNYRTPSVALPDRYAAVPEDATVVSASRPSVSLALWWRALNDPVLDGLIDQAVRNNPDVLVALDRLQAARTYEAGLTGTALPAIGVSAAYGRGTGDDLSRGRAAAPLVSADSTHDVSQVNAVGGFDAVWQIDVFGKIRRQIEAARDTAQAAAAARNAVLVSVVADVARAYVELRGLQVRTAVLQSALGILQQSQRIVSIRYQRGITNELDLTLANRELASFRAQLAPLQAQVQSARYAIATLIGSFPEQLPSQLDQPALIPTVPVDVQPGLPLQLLRRRPDIQQAEHELAAANARIGVATASLFPQLDLTGALGAQEADLGTGDASGAHIWGVGPGVVWPLLDFGQLDAQVRIANLRTRVQLVQYRATIQRAVQQVDTAAATLSAQQQNLLQLGDAVVASQRAVTLANQRYDRGLTDFLNVVDAEREQYSIEEQYVESQASVDDDFVALYRALGGGWQDYQQVPGIARPLPAVVAMFRDTLAGRRPPSLPATE